MVPGPRLRTIGTAVAVALVTAACTGGNDGPSSAATATSIQATTTTAPYRDDGVYRIAVFAPRDGEGATVGRGVRRGVSLAADEMNAAGGVAGQPVELVDVAEPSDPNAAILAARSAVETGDVDAVIGPTSSAGAASVATALLDGHTLACSPTATSYTLTDLPDGGRLVRTIGSDRLEAAAMARVLADTGRFSTAVLTPDDDYGLAYAEALKAALPAGFELRGVDVYDLASDDYGEVTRKVLERDADTVTVVGTGASGARALTAVLEGVGTTMPASGVPVLVSSGLRSVGSDPGFAPELAGEPGTLVGIAPLATGQIGFEERLATTWPDEVNPYAAYAYDCAVLLALAAATAGTADPEQAKDQLGAVAQTGSLCQSYADCVALASEGRNIDFDGASGTFGLDGAGDRSVAQYDYFAIDPAGQDRSIRTIPVRAS